jgi:hypothetical protein
MLFRQHLFAILREQQFSYVGQTSGLPAPHYRGAVIIVLTVAVPLAPQGSRELRAQADSAFFPFLAQNENCWNCWACASVC